MNNYNQPPAPPSIELKEIVKSTLGLTEAGLINVFNQFDNHCFETLNTDACEFELEWYLGKEYGHNIDQLQDLSDFINEVRV